MSDPSGSNSNGGGGRRASSNKQVDYGALAAATEAVKEMLAAASVPDGRDASSGDDCVSLTGLRDRRLDAGCYFDDGLRSVDFVLAWEEDLQPQDNGMSPADSRDASTLQSYRRRFESNLLKAGLQMEEECSTSSKKVIHFVKLFIPWDIMCYYAEALCLRAPLQVHQNPTENWSAKLLNSLGLPNLMDQTVPNQPADYYTCPFRKSKLSRFLGSDSQDTYFTPTQRHQVAREILSSQAYGKGKRAEVGIDRLLEEGVYTGAFPLHEGPCELPQGRYNPEDLNPRQILHDYWARWGLWHKYQPLDHIREYYGEKIGLYFAWLGLYTAWLLPASLVGLLVFVYGCVTIRFNVPAEEVCNSSKEYKMCPTCDEAIGCEYWYLSDVCLYVRFSYLFDHPGTVFYAVFVSLWAVTFLEMWKRKGASLAHHWDVADFAATEERPRPEYSALCTAYQRNPVTGQVEPHFPDRQRLPRLLTGVACIVVMLVIVIIFIIAVIAYRLVISIPLFRHPLFHSRAALVASLSAALINLVLIMCLGLVYERLAYRLTRWEMHRTQSEFEDQLTLKVFIFQFVNYYSSIVYIAFFKGKFTGYPGHYGTFLGLRNEQCDNGGCLIELAQQLAVIMIGKQVINNCQEIILPKLATWLHQFRSGLSNLSSIRSSNNKQSKQQQQQLQHQQQELTRCEADYLLIPYEGLIDEYLEVVLQFGFITIFVAAFPLAPLFALANNWLEIRLDAAKLVRLTRRPVAERGQGIGVWFLLLDALVQLSVVSNAFLIAFTSEFLPRQLYKYAFSSEDLSGYTNFTLAWAPANSTEQPCRYRAFRNAAGDYSEFYWHLLAVRLAFIIVFEHAVFLLARLLDALIPDVPEVLRIKIRREQYLARQALMDAEIELHQQQHQQLPQQQHQQRQAGAEPVASARH